MARSKERSVRDVMVKDVVTIEPTASLTDAARRMDTANIGMLPVVDNGRVKGVITDRDIVVRAVARAADPRTTKVGDCLSGGTISAHPDWTTDRAMQAMAQLLQRGRPPSEVMALTAAEDLKRGPYLPCPCGSGQKFRFCHGDRAPHSPFSGISPARAAPAVTLRGRNRNRSTSVLPASNVR